MPTPSEKIPREILNVLTSDALFGAAMKLMRNRALAEDLVQDTSIKVIEAYRDGRFDGRNVVAWVFTSLRRRGLNTLDYNQRRQSSGRDPEVLVGSGVLPDEKIFALEKADATAREAARARSAVERLPDRFRDVFVQRHVEGKGYKETARILGIPEGTVLSRTYRARAMVRADLGAAA